VIILDRPVASSLPTYRRLDAGDKWWLSRADRVQAIKTGATSTRSETSGTDKAIGKRQ
jgi:hypothetical protein